MWIQVRSFDGKKLIRVDNLSKLTKIEDLRKKLEEPFEALPELQRLFYRGKQLVDGHSLFDYDVGLNDLVQIMVRKPVLQETVTATPDKQSTQSSGYNSGEEGSSDKENEKPVEVQPSSSSTDEVESMESLYKVGDIVDGRDKTMGAWFEAKIVKITRTDAEHTVSASPADSDSDKTVKTDPESEANCESTDIDIDSEIKVTKSDPESNCESTDIDIDSEIKVTKSDPESNCESTDIDIDSEIKVTKSDPESNCESTDIDIDSEIKVTKSNPESENTNSAKPMEVDSVNDRLSYKQINSDDVELNNNNTTNVELNNNNTTNIELNNNNNNNNNENGEKSDIISVALQDKLLDKNSNETDIHESSNEPCDETTIVTKSVNNILSTKERRSLEPLEELAVDDGFLYHVKYEGYENEEDIVKLDSNHIRPRARQIIKFSSVRIGTKLMANYNYDEPDRRGYWYDCVISKKRDTRSIKELLATVYLGADLMPLKDCQLLFVNELFEIETAGSQLNELDVANDPTASPMKRQSKPECDHCLDNPRKKCKFCACAICGGKNNPDTQIMCDECDNAFHIDCLNPPLKSIPDDDEWYCPDCKNDSTEVVQAGEKLKASKKKSKMASASATTSRDWGKGMACVGKTKHCSIVPANHFGPVPGVQVGMLWKFRVQASEAGAHRPHVAGIHGREEDGAFSIVLSGGYEDDVDNGGEFTYTGSGGRDLSGNKRTADQSCDQILTRMNKALAKNCNASIDNKNGATAKDWQAGKPVRVIRNCKGHKHSKYAPEEGNRYDGIYKIVKYWPEKGKSGYNVWRYLLRRDDPVPAPWTKEGKKRVKQLGLTMQYPDGYLEAQAQKEKEKEEAEGTEGKSKGKKRKSQDEDSFSEPTRSKKSKSAEYKLEPDIAKLVKQDTKNKKIWDDALSYTPEGAQKFLVMVEELYACVCCHDIVFKPVTTDCKHNVCKSCLSRSFKADVFSCPACRNDLGQGYKMPINQTLSSILNGLFPGYEAGR